MDTGRHHRGHFQLEGKPTVGNASMDDTDAAATATIFFPTDGKSIVHILSIVPFVIQAHVECLPYLPIYVFKCPFSLVGCDFVDGVLNMGGSSEGDDSRMSPDLPRGTG
jgi:hypothetical protein